MKIAVAQTSPVKGDIAANLSKHQQMAESAAALGARLVVFPELSITGYEPELAKELAADQNDPRLEPLQSLSNEYGITIGVGMPIAVEGSLPQIGLIFFQPDQPRITYAKQHLHADEIPYFSPGNQQVYLELSGFKIGLAICYELSVPEHAANVHQAGADIYLVSEAKTVPGVEKAIHTLTDTSARYDMAVLMSNCIGLCDNTICGGRSAVWDNKGNLLTELEADQEGILVLDLASWETQSIIG
ncbi:carbon-nitrogen hydrolase family protein [Paraflavitalea pollutisoli]|uniref:carbon-nitrogen hydrolase family protein n=1 Tax=Paraflavitalea pollutisoli TaxID=3034143 RepID=UPI0023EC85BD|nr:carbon-nitrogen hydrolase family protein [Paraflavitalea sp. H1-2-19X]